MRPAGAARAGRARRRARRERGAAFGRRGHGEPCGPPGLARQPVGRHSSRGGRLSGRPGRTPASAARSPAPGRVPAELGRHDAATASRSPPAAARRCRGRGGAGRRRRGSAPSRPGRRPAPGPRAGRRGAGPSRRGVAAVRQGGAARPSRRTTRSTARSATARAVVYLTPCRLTRPGRPSSASWSCRRGRVERPDAPPRPGTSPSWTRAASAPLDPGPGKGAGRLVEERHGVARRRLGRLVRGAHDRAPLPGHEEEEAALAARPHREGDGRRRGAGRRCARAGGARAARREAAAREDLVGPGARRVHDHAGPDLERAPGERVAHRDPRDPARRPAGGRRPPRGSPASGARVGGGVDEAEREPLGARRLRVVPEGGAGEAAPLEAGHEAQRLGGGDGPRGGDAVARGAGRGCGRG